MSKNSYRVCLVNSWMTLTLIFSASKVLQVAGKDAFWINLSVHPVVQRHDAARQRVLKGVFGVSHDRNPHGEGCDGRWCQLNTLTATDANTLTLMKPRPLTSFKPKNTMQNTLLKITVDCGCDLSEKQKH